MVAVAAVALVDAGTHRRLDVPGLRVLATATAGDATLSWAAIHTRVDNLWFVAALAAVLLLPVQGGTFVALLAITGLLLFVSKATSYVINPYFLWKMSMMALAGLNMMYFHFITWRTVAHWDRDASMPTAVKVAAGLSIVFWILVVFFGRAIGFTLGIFY